MSDDKLRRFGRYLILDHLVDGGMAKICRARFLGEQADKVVAIKMIQPQFSADENFKTMFLDEIKVTFALNHPNIAATYDYGLHESQLFTAMEYVDGKNLKQFLDRLKEKKFVFPVEISTYIVSQICQGLSYAHNFTDKLSGEKLNIIHRDISPHNVMLTFDGAVKVIDFGIAKAETNSEATQAGTIKGKLSYLAPEYLDGAKLDHRYDQFAVGVTLWELLCSRKLFQAPNELATLKLIQNCNIPAPSSINPNVPAELDQIILKSLSKDRELRYEDMDQFNRALVKFLYSNYPDFNASDLKHFSQELFLEDIKKDRAKLYEFGQIDIAPYLRDLKREMKGQSAGTKTQTSVDPDEPKRKAYVNFELEDSAKSESTSQIKLEKFNDKTSTKVKRLKDMKRKKKVAATGQRVPGKTQVIKNPNATGKSKDSIKSSVSNDKKSNARSPLFGLFVAASVAGALYLNKDFLIEFVSTQMGVVDINRTPASINNKNTNLDGRLILTDLRAYHTVYIDDDVKSYTTLGIELPINKKITLRVEQDNRKPFITSFRLTEDDNTMSIKIPELKKVKWGEIYSSTDYPRGTELILLMDGQEIRTTMPVKSYKLPVGSYDAIIYNKALDISKKISINVEEEKRVKIQD